MDILATFLVLDFEIRIGGKAEIMSASYLVELTDDLVADVGCAFTIP